MPYHVEGAMHRDAFRRAGATGLHQHGGLINEEWLHRLRGRLGARIYQEMGDNGPTIGAMTFAMEMLLRSVEWNVVAYSESAEHQEHRNFLESCRDDMEDTWSDFISEWLTMVRHGWSAFEQLYKVRLGPHQEDPEKRSRHSDGRIGWRAFEPRAQDTLLRWDFDDGNRVRGLWQQVTAEHGGTFYVPAEKLLLFRTTSRKGNPEGRSAYRNAFRPWFLKKSIENSEAIGIERDLAGLPIFWLPQKYFEDNPKAKALREEYLKFGSNLRQDEQGCMVLPSIYDDAGNQLLRFELAGTGSRRLYDTTAIIDRLDRQITQTMLADFIMLGSQPHGSFALSSDKTRLYALAAGAWLKSAADVLNRHAVPALYELNGLDPAERAWFEPGDLEDRNVQEFAAAVAQLGATGWLSPGGGDDERAIRQMVGLPEQAFEDPRREVAFEPEDEADDFAPMPQAPDPREVVGPAASLNGDQVTSMVDVVARVVSGQLPRQSAVEIITAAFPVDRQQAEAIVGDAGRGFVPTPEPEQGP